MGTVAASTGGGELTRIQKESTREANGGGGARKAAVCRTFRPKTGVVFTPDTEGTRLKTVREEKEE